MPSYEFECTENECKHEWEEFLSITAEIPKNCPKCQKESVKRLISLGSKGVVELYGQDLVDKLKSDAKKISKEAAQKETVYSNLLGESKYQQIQTQMDKRKRR